MLGCLEEREGKEDDKNGAVLMSAGFCGQKGKVKKTNGVMTKGKK